MKQESVKYHSGNESGNRRQSANRKGARQAPLDSIDDGTYRIDVNTGPTIHTF